MLTRIIPVTGIEREQQYGNSQLFLPIGGKAAGTCVISDPLRPEASKIISSMRALGFARIVILTGDNRRTAEAIAKQPGLSGLPFVTLLSRAAISRIHLDVKLGITLNTLYLLGALTGLLGPALTAVLHNLTTISISLNAIRLYSIEDKTLTPVADCVTE